MGRGLNKDGFTNPLLGVLSSSNRILKGSEFQRVPDAIAAGSSYRTEKISGGSFPTPTNISQDFPIGPVTHITFRAEARYLFLTRADTQGDSQPVSLNISRVQQNLLLDWLNDFGLVGSNADLQSDIDGDGLTLVEEFAFRKDPTADDANENSDFSFAPGISQLSNDGGIAPLTLSFGGRRDAPLRYTGQFSSNLRDWDSVPVLNPFLSNQETAASSIFLFSDPNPGPSRFGRLTVEYIQPTAN